MWTGSSDPLQGSGD